MTSVSTTASSELPSASVAPTVDPTDEASVEAADARGGLTSRSFLALLGTLFLVAVNDNMFRWLVVPIGKDLLGSEARALSIGLACFVSPFLLLAGPAGFVVDRFSKRSVIIGCKVAEIVIMVMGIIGILWGNTPLMFAVLFLMGAQSALFSPAKFGSIPEIIRADRLQAANGLVGLATMAACILGTVAGNYLYTLTTLDQAASASVGPGQHRWWISAVALLGVAIVGWVMSLGIGRLQAANPHRPATLNVFKQTFHDLGYLFNHRALFLAACGTTFFWLLAALAQTNVDLFTRNTLAIEQQYVGHLLAMIALGVGLGSLLAGWWSGGKVEVGIVPIGAAGIAAASLLLWTVPEGTPGATTFTGYYWSMGWLLLLGVSAGLYDIPLQAFLQDRSPEATRGRVLAATNFMVFSGMLVASGAFLFLSDGLGLSPRGVFAVAGLAVIPVVLFIVYLIPAATLRFLLTRLLRLVYRIRVRGLENIPEHGPALLVPNHVSWVDGLLVGMLSPRPVRMMIWADYMETPWLHWFFEAHGAIPIRPGKRSVVESIRKAREALQQGEVVCIFPEGGLTRTGQMQAFRPGFLSILKNTEAPVIPVYLHGLWGSIFSFERGRFFWKFPRRWPYPVTMHFGRLMEVVGSVHQVRSTVERMGAEAIQQEEARAMVLPRRFLRCCRRAMFRPKLADSTGLELTGAEVLTRTLILRRLLRREVLADDESTVGLLLPPSVAAVLANAAVTLDRRVAVNLNYTLSPQVIEYCIRRAGVRHVLTSRRVIERLDLKIDAELVYLEDLRDHVTLADKLVSAAAAWLVPSAILERWLGLHKVDWEDLLTIIFTSGSTGQPKGVMLTHRNVGSNVGTVDQILHLRNDDILIGILPLFHSFGYTATMWTALTLAPKAVYHYTPLEAKQIGSLVRKHKATILVGTPTFLRSYLRRCPPEDFATLDAVIAGAEKLPTELAEAFEKKFGVRPTEGYGTTELSPVVAANIPPSRSPSGFALGLKEGTIGRALPGISAKVVDLETGKELEPGQSGMLWVRGPNVMKGYLDEPEMTAKVIRDGWYETGDVAEIDDEGFIRITGRISRFSKIGGEMVPHLRVEEAINEALELGEDEVRAVVTGVPDQRKGERLIVLYTELPMGPEAVRQALQKSGLPTLWIPGQDSFYQVDEIPVLGTGKLDIKTLKALAQKRVADAV